MAKSVSKNSIFYLIYTSLNVIFPFITGVYVSHVLLEGAIGEVEAARNIAQYFVILAYLGIPTYGLREIAKAKNDKESLNKVFSELAIINFISTIVFLVIYIGVIIAVPSYRSNVLLYLITGGSVALNVLNITWLYEGLEEFSFICVRNLIFKILCFAGLIIFVRKSDDYLIYAAITVVGTAGNYLLNVFRARKHVRFTFKNLNLKRHMKSILFLVVVNLAIEIYTLVDITMLKFLSKNENIAYYSYGSKIYKIFINLLNSFTMVVVPRITSFYKEKKKDEFNHLISKTLKVIILLSVPMIIGTYFVSDYLIVAIYGPSYIKSSQVLKILSVLFFVSPVGYLLGSRIMLVVGKENKMVYPVLIGAAVNIIANYFLIKQFQETGAAMASVISEMVVAFTYIMFSKKYIKIVDFWSDLFKILIANGMMSLVLCFIYFSAQYGGLLTTLREIVLAISIYFLSLFILNETTTVQYSKLLLRKLL